MLQYVMEDIYISLHKCSHLDYPCWPSEFMSEAVEGASIGMWSCSTVDKKSPWPCTVV